MGMEENFVNNLGKKTEEGEKRKRMDNLRKEDNSYEDTVYDIAKEEDEYRKLLQEEGIDDEGIKSRLADRFSDKDLERAETEKQRWIDELTDLKNRNAYNGEIPQLIEMLKRQEQEGSFLMIDFDHFKIVNDTYGHKAGDMVLKNMSKVIKDTLRDSDAMYRYGGEEFIVYLPDTDSKGAQIIAERIKNTIAETDIDIVDKENNELKLKKTVSMGCVGTDQIDNWENIKTEKLMGIIENYTDRALYASKENGRNQVTIFDESLGEVE